MKEFKIGFSFLILLIIIYITFPNLSVKNVRTLTKENKEINHIVDKFFRDLINFNVYTVIPEKFIIELKNLDSYQMTSHVHGISLGKDKEDIVEIYINKNSWEKFNKTQKYYIIYHELSHDILNLDDLNENESNFGKIMYPNMSIYNTLDMNDFIENMKKLFSNLDK